MVYHKFKKYHTNGQPLDDKFTVGSQKTFRFMVEAKDSTMSIYTKTTDSAEKVFPMLYVPIICFDRIGIENVQVGIINQNNLALIYPILLTSSTNSIVNID